MIILNNLKKGLPLEFVFKVKNKHFFRRHFSRKYISFYYYYGKFIGIVMEYYSSSLWWWGSHIITCLLLLKWHQARNSGKSMHTFSLENKLLELQIGRGWQNHQHVLKYLRPTGLMMVYSCAKFLIWKMRCCLLSALGSNSIGRKMRY